MRINSFAENGMWGELVTTEDQTGKENDGEDKTDDDDEEEDAPPKAKWNTTFIREKVREREREKKTEKKV